MGWGHFEGMGHFDRERAVSRNGALWEGKGTLREAKQNIQRHITLRDAFLRKYYGFFLSSLFSLQLASFHRHWTPQYPIISLACSKQCPQVLYHKCLNAKYMSLYNPTSALSMPFSALPCSSYVAPIFNSIKCPQCPL